jgi:sugar phosphate isomerase/epimerase
MKNRREFLKNSGALALGSFLLPQLLRAESMKSFPAVLPIGIQLYTLNHFLGDDVKATLQQIASIGFTYIESASSAKGMYYGYTPKELASILNGMGMKWISHHVSGGSRMQGATTKTGNEQPAQNKNNAPPRFPTLRDNLQQLVDEAAAGGLEYLVCASTPIGTMDEVKASIETFVKAGEACKKAGIQFVYHNHATEFDPVEGGKSAYDLVLSQTDKELVKMELDLAWAAKAKQTPVELFKQNPGRFPLWHVKDFDLVNNKITSIGNGSIDFKPTFAAAEEAGMKHFFYEQDNAQSMDDVRLSFTNLSKIIS